MAWPQPEKTENLSHGVTISCPVLPGSVNTSIISDRLARGFILTVRRGADGARPGLECGLHHSEHRCVLRSEPASLGEVRDNAPDDPHAAEIRTGQAPSSHSECTPCITRQRIKPVIWHDKQLRAPNKTFRARRTVEDSTSVRQDGATQ